MDFSDNYLLTLGTFLPMVGVLVLDCGTGLQEPAARAAQAAADQIVLISDAHPATASLVAEAAELLPIDRSVEPQQDDAWRTREHERWKAFVLGAADL